MTKAELLHARMYAEGELINILVELGAEVQFTIGRRKDGMPGPIGFQAFWPTGVGYDGRHADYDARAHANTIP